MAKRISGFLLAISLVTLPCGATDLSWAGVCQSDKPEMAAVVGAVEVLPEVKALVKSIAPLKAAVVPPGAADRTQVHARCGTSVAVYVDRQERFELWHVFFVEDAGLKVTYVMNYDGEFVSIDVLRSENRH